MVGWMVLVAGLLTEPPLAPSEPLEGAAAPCVLVLREEQMAAVACLVDGVAQVRSLYTTTDDPDDYATIHDRAWSLRDAKAVLVNPAVARLEHLFWCERLSWQGVAIREVRQFGWPPDHPQTAEELYRLHAVLLEILPHESDRLKSNLCRELTRIACCQACAGRAAVGRAWLAAKRD